MSRILGLALLVVCASAPAVAQTAGGHRGFLIGGGDYLTATSWAIQVDASGKAVTFSTGHSGGPWLTWGRTFGLTMSADNLTVVVPGILGTVASPTTFGLMKYDPAARAMVGTIWSGVGSTLSVTSYGNLTMNANGEIVTIDNAHAVPALAVFDPSTGIWTRHDLGYGHRYASGLGGLEWDKMRGGYVHSDFFRNALYRTSPDHRRHTTLALGANVVALARFGGTLMENGDWVSSTCCAYRYLRVRAGATLFTAGPSAAGLVSYDVTHAKYAAPGQGFWAANFYPYDARFVDYDRDQATVVYTPSGGAWPDRAYEILPLHGRDLGSERIGPGPGGAQAWSLYINPGAGMFAGKRYVIAASLAPPAPYPNAPHLPDGREIYIGIDALTAATIRAPLPPVLTGTHGVLDARGLGTARITLPPHWRALNGNAIHFCGVILDPGAPSGIAWVTEPHAFVIDIP